MEIRTELYQLCEFSYSTFVLGVNSTKFQNLFFNKLPETRVKGEKLGCRVPDEFRA